MKKLKRIVLAENHWDVIECVLIGIIIILVACEAVIGTWLIIELVRMFI